GEGRATRSGAKGEGQRARTSSNRSAFSSRFAELRNDDATSPSPASEYAPAAPRRRRNRRGGSGRAENSKSAATPTALSARLCWKALSSERCSAPEPASAASPWSEIRAASARR